MKLQYFFAQTLNYAEWQIFKNALTILKIYPNLQDGCYSEIRQNTGVEGLKFDFNFGLRMDIPNGDFHVKVSDGDSGTIFFDDDISNKRLISFEKNYIRWHIEVLRGDEMILQHDFNLRGKSVLIHFPYGLLGDTLAFLPYINEFKKIHGADVTLLLAEYLREFAAHVYPELAQVTENNYDSYATFYPAMHLTDLNFLTWNTNQFPMENSSGDYFGINRVVKNSKFTPTMPRLISEPYVCIAIQASSINKTWLYPNGWKIIADFLKNLGYRVVCIDKAAEIYGGGYEMKMPANAEDFTGDYSIMHRANMLYHAEFFVGLGSGLSWLANAVDCPVVLIGGFTVDWYEFYTPYRVANRFVCNGCYNDNRVSFPKKFCFFHKDTTRELECAKKISPRMVKTAIEDLIVNENLKVPALGNFSPRRQ